MAHRVAYELFIGPIPKGLLLRHTCDTPPCVQPLDLLTGTHPDNMQDRSERGRQMRGESHYAAQLTTEDVLRIRELAARGENQHAIGAAFGVSNSTVSAIARRINWKHV